MNKLYSYLNLGEFRRNEPEMKFLNTFINYSSECILKNEVCFDITKSQKNNWISSSSSTDSTHKKKQLSHAQELD